MKFEGTKISGFIPAIIGMRLPMSKNYEDACSKSDSYTVIGTDGSEQIYIGENDMKVALNLINADDSIGVCQPNSKFLQMIEVWVSIEAPLAFWKEADTYRHSVKNSTSTMHRIQSYPITEECIELNPLTNKCSVNKKTIIYLEKLRQRYVETRDKSVWYELIYNLPDSWLQTRMFHVNYATLRNMITWRVNHKQNCWSGKDNPELENFISWAKTLPYSEEFLFSGVKK